MISNTSLSEEGVGSECVEKRKRNLGEGQLLPHPEISFALETKYCEILTSQFISKI